MSTVPEIRRMVTREMIEAHYKSVMNAARLLLSQGETIHAQDLLSEACSRPYPSPAPASMPEAPGAHPALQGPTTADTDRLIDAALNNLDAANRLLSLHEPKAPGAQREQTTAQTSRLIDAAPELLAAVRLSIAMRAAQAAYFKTRSREALIACKQAEKALDKAAALVVAKATGTARGGTP